MTHSVYKLYDFFPELSDLYFLLKPSLTTKTQVDFHENTSGFQIVETQVILGNELNKYLGKCDSNFLISRQLILGIKNHPREGWLSIHSEQTFQLFSQLMKLYVIHNYAACFILIQF